MKFIRDIIGEKRQSRPEGSVPAGHLSAATRDSDTRLAADTEVRRMAPVPEPDLLADDVDDGTDNVADDIAAFFANEEAEMPRPAAPSPSPALRTAHAPTRLVPGPVARSAAAAPEPETAPEPANAIVPDEEVAPAMVQPASVLSASVASASVASTSVASAFDDDHDTTHQIDRVLFSDHRPDPMLEATLRAARQREVPATHDQATHDEDARAQGQTTQEQAAQEDTPSPATAFELSQAWRRQDDVPSQPRPVAEPEPDPALAVSMPVPQPAMGRGEARHGRVKTRLLGFNTSPDAGLDPIASQQEAPHAPYTSFPVGWLIVVEGAGRGSAFSLFGGVSTIGRSEDQTVRLDFGDNAISRENHAAIAYDPMQKSFFIGHGGKANLVRRNNRPVLSTEELSAGDRITIGETVLHFVPLCGPEFSWDSAAQDG